FRVGIAKAATVIVMGGRAAKKHHVMHKQIRLNEWWLRYEYKHTTIAIAGIVLFVALLDSALLTSIFHYLEGLGYVGGLVAGVLSASFFTAAPAVLLIIDLATKHDPLLLALIIGIGAAVGDMLLLLFFEERIFHELKPLYLRVRSIFTKKKPGKPRRSAAMLLLGTFIITTPLPDEIGLGILGISHFPKIVLLVICLGLNVLGAAILILAARAVAG
ncbi:MAG TPA: hypothetical protein VLA88_01460, partial [Candidatus Saccharimonadales bacterium]|nr:hypothetical protein [Candidatus Saccharimonadales bacterium]